MLLQKIHSPNFNTTWLDLLDQDPVHNITPDRPLERRIAPDRDIFMLTESDVPVAVLCVAYTTTLPDNIEEIISSTSPVQSLDDARYAIFYSVFKTNNHVELPNPGAKIIRLASQWIHDNYPAVRNFVTMSPIPALSTEFTTAPTDFDQIRGYLENCKDPVARFHTNNGAKVYRVIPNADTSPRRQEQSWGFMVNYDYTSQIIKTI
jgi:malonyl-CoA decarboxylase